MSTLCLAAVASSGASSIDGPPLGKPVATSSATGPAAQASPTTRQFDNVLYTPPPDWAVRQLDFAVELNPTTTVGQELLVVWILRGRASREDADALREEGIEVMSVPVPAGLKGTVQ